MFIQSRLGLAAVIVLAGCGGGASSSLPPQQIAHSVAPAGKQNTAFIIHLPAPPSTAANARRPAYISYSTKSLQINVDPGTPSEQDHEFDLTVQSGNCVASGLLGVLTCTLSMSILPGSHTVNLIAYDQTGGTAGGGKALSASYGFPLTIVAGASNSPTFTLGGITASLVIVPLDSTAAKGDGVVTPISFTSASATNFLVEALDADKNPIIGPASPALTFSNSNASALPVTPNASNPYEFQIQPKSASASPIVVTFSAPDMTGQGKPATTFAVTFAPLFTPQLTCGSGTCIDTAASAEKGGSPALRRIDSSSAAMVPRSPRATAARTGWSGTRVCTSIRAEAGPAWRAPTRRDARTSRPRVSSVALNRGASR